MTQAWVQRYSNVATNSHYRVAQVVRDGSDDIIVVGTLYGEQMLTIKYSGVDSSLLWSRLFEGGLYEDRDCDHPYDPAVAVDSTGNVVVTVASGGGFRNRGYYTAKYAATDGALLWERAYAGSWNSDDAARAVAVDGSGNVVVTGFSFGTNSYDCHTFKYAATDGALLWEQRHNARVFADYDQFVAVDTGGNAVVALTSISTNCCGSPEDYFTAKYAASDGALLWQTEYDTGSRDVLSSVALDADGNVVVSGSSGTFKYAAGDGAQLWEKPDNGYGGALAVDAGGNVLVSGRTGSAKYAGADGGLVWEWHYTNGLAYARGLSVDGSGNVIVMLSFLDGSGNRILGHYIAQLAAADGTVLWGNRTTGPADANDFPQSMAVDASGNVVVTGYAYFGWNSALSYSGYDYYAAKYAASDGASLWDQHYAAPGNHSNAARAVAVDRSGNVVVTGASSNGRVNDYYTAKYSAADGALLWEKRYNAGGYWASEARAVAIDYNGNVVVSGSSAGTNGWDYYTAKYAARDGGLMWEKRYNGLSWDVAGALVVDASGNVFVTGGSYTGDGNTDYYTAKYAAVDGALLWTNRYNGQANDSDYATAMAIDGDGNVVVTGSSYVNNIHRDYYTAKYAAVDGALLWEKRYHGPYEGPDFDQDEARAVAVDTRGNVVVTGSSANSSGDDDFYTAKYAASDGALLWENRYNGPGNSVDYANAVAVDGSGNAIVTGISQSGTRSNSYTAKYAAADGTVIWEKQFSGGSYAIAVDGSGNVLVAGTSEGDYYTAKYASADGALLWEKRYHSGAITGLAIGPYGMVVVTGVSAGDYATVVYRESLSIDRISAGVRLQYTGGPGDTYHIERAPAIDGPWRTLASVTASASGLIAYADTLAPPGQAFYRLVQP